MKELKFPHQDTKVRLLKYEKKLKASPLTIFLNAIKKEKLNIKVG